jgi:Cys-tRNA synthase (O-phospho-L-seryl-tRNA:Cys-tRNA synthase)
MTDKDIGNMYIFNNECLMVSSSSIVQFFVKEWDDVIEETRWIYHHTLRIRGFIFFNIATSRLQIINEEKIFAYIMNKQTNLPDIESVTYNYMKCSLAVFGRK